MKNSLQGRCILLTRSLIQSQEIAATIQDLGGHSLILACMKRSIMNQAIEQGWDTLKASSKAHILFSSVNGIEAVQAVVGLAFAPLMNQHHVIAVGSKTAQCLHAAGVNNVAVPQLHSQEGVLRLLKASKLPNTLFFFRAEKARDFLQKALIQLGVKVFAVHSYRMHCPQSDATQIIQALAQGEVDAVLLGSPQTVRHYLRRIKDISIANNAVLVAISPRVAETAKTLGLKISMTSEQASFTAMLAQLHHYFEGKKS